MRMFTDSVDVVSEELCSRKFFTPSEANRSIVLVEKIAEDMIFEYARLLDLQEMIDAAAACGAQDQAETGRAEVIDSVEKLRVCLEELDFVGVELRDWSRCMIDYPCMIGGQEVRLCWQAGEKRVNHWHDFGEDCGKRRRIETLSVYETMLL